MLELCDIYSRRKECPRTRETGTFRSLVILCTVKSSVWLPSLVFITVVPCCEMLRGQNTLRGRRAVGLERPHELLWARKRAQKWGRSSPIRCFVRAQMHRHAMRNFFCFGLFQEISGEPKSEPQGDLCLSCTVHPRRKHPDGRIQKLHENGVLLLR